MHLLQIKRFDDETKSILTLMFFSTVPLSKEREVQGKNSLYMHILARRCRIDICRSIILIDGI